MVFGNNELRLADILHFHPAGILTHLGARPDDDHDLGVAVEDVGMGPMAVLIAGVDGVKRTVAPLGASADSKAQRWMHRPAAGALKVGVYRTERLIKHVC